MTKEELAAFVEQHRIPGSNIVYDKNGTPETGSYYNKQAAEVASNLYLGSHYYYNPNGTIEVYGFGKHLVTL
tara:strand:- start:1639 stop:1854 length:216 start_codon:yes stop_codon:yes gene_type:complete